MSFPRYPEYKGSGAAWLGDVPTHWEVQQGRRLYMQKRDAALPDDEQLSATQKYGVVPQRLFMELEDQKVTLALSGLDNFKHVESDDFVISLRSFQGGIERSKYSGCVSPAYTVLRATVAVDAGFMAYVLKSPGYIAALQSVTDGIRDGKNISYEQFGQIGLPYPSQAEQRVIAAFLDRETAKIDTLVAEQEKLIALLKEKRQAVISHAITKGLDPDVPMKDSGVEWLGEVPAHWAITPLKWLTDPERPIMYGIVLPGPDVGEGIPILKGGNVKPSRMNLESMARTTPAIEAPYARARLKAGDLVYSIRGTIGDCESVPAELEGSNITQDVARIATASGVNTPWVRWALLASAIRDDLACGSLGAAVRGINIFDLKRARIPTPPPEEQAKISAFVNAETEKLDALTAEGQRAIDLLREHRAALIAAAVTGKIDVRGLAAASVSLETSCV